MAYLGYPADTTYGEPPPTQRRCNNRHLPNIGPSTEVTPGRVACGTVTDPAGVIRRATIRAVEMLDSTIGELVNARNRVCAGEPPVPILRDITAYWLRNRLSVCIDDIRVWTAGTFENIRSVAEVIRRLIRVRNLIASNTIRYVCNPHATSCGVCMPGEWAFVCISRPCPKGAVPTIVYLCKSFWVSAVRADSTLTPQEIQETHAEFQAQTIIHEASHLYHCTRDPERGGSTIGVAECLSQFVAATNGSPIDCGFAAACVRTNRCGAADGAGAGEDPCVVTGSVGQIGIEGFGTARTAPKMIAVRTVFHPEKAIRLKGRPPVRR